MKHILYLPTWFPNRRDHYSGDFIKRHAEAASRYDRITILFTAVDDEINEPETDKEIVNENLTVYTFYYPAKKGIFSPALNGIKRFNALKRLYQQIFKETPPDLVHVHVSYPAGLFALYLKKRKKLDYVITEHNTIYLTDKYNTFKPGNFEKKMTALIFKNAKEVNVVSKALANSLKSLQLVSDPDVIPNVVNTEIFNYKENQKEKEFRFIHVSSLSYQKNPEGMLAAFSIVKKKRSDFQLVIIGPPVEKVKRLVYDLSLSDNVILLNEIPYSEVAKEISKSHAMVHFTRYETFGCVIAESLCCGVPVIVSDLGVTRELITDKENGLFVTESDVNDLAEKILLFMESGFIIDSKQIAENSKKKFNYNRVGKMFHDLYTSMTSN